MANKEIEALLRKVFADEWEEAAGGAPFRELACWDSLHYVQWVVGVQTTFKIDLNQSQILRLVSLSGLETVLKEHGIQF